jgi:hypothetical protein
MNGTDSAIDSKCQQSLAEIGQVIFSSWSTSWGIKILRNISSLNKFYFIIVFLLIRLLRTPKFLIFVGVIQLVLVLFKSGTDFLTNPSR